MRKPVVAAVAAVAAVLCVGSAMAWDPPCGKNRCQNSDNCVLGTSGSPGYCTGYVTNCHDLEQCANCSCSTTGGCWCGCLAPSKTSTCVIGGGGGGKTPLQENLFRTFTSSGVKPPGLIDFMQAIDSGWTITSNISSPSPADLSLQDQTLESLLLNLASAWGGCVSINDATSTIEFRNPGGC